MTEHKEHKPEAAPKPPFTAEQEARLREIIVEELAKWDVKQLHERRFGTTVQHPKEHK